MYYLSSYHTCDFLIYYIRYQYDLENLLLELLDTSYLWGLIKSLPLYTSY